MMLTERAFKVPDNEAGSKRKLMLFVLFVVVILAMCSDVSHNFLWGPDEPRDAEIARETLSMDHWIVPRLCGLAFLEKPPLYYDLIALSFEFSGRIVPPVARAISCMLGIAMLAAVFFFGYKWGGLRRGIICLLLLAGMPQFFRYSHWVLVDIGVGCFCAMGLTLFAWWFFWPAGEKTIQQIKLCLFYLVCALAFLTKGVIACFHIFAVIGFLFMAGFRSEKSTGKIRGFFSPMPLLFFIVPVGLWLFFFCKEGGLCYLHEHFINNLLGRFLHRHFQMEGCRFYHTDIGNTAPWYEYLDRLPDMIGVTYLLLPFATWNLIKNYRRLKSEETAKCRNGSLKLFLAIWTFLPGIILSFAAQKEVSYLLPSYAGAALFAGGWLDGRLSSNRSPRIEGLYWILLVVPVSLATFRSFIPDSKIYILINTGFLSLFLPVLLYFLFSKRYSQAVFLVLAIQLGAVVAGNNPKVIFDTRLHAKTYGEMATKIKEIAGNSYVYLYRPDDYLRGSISFYNNTLTPELDRVKDVLQRLAIQDSFLILSEQHNMEELENISGLHSKCSLVNLPDFQYKAKYDLLLCNNQKE